MARDKHVFSLRLRPENAEKIKFIADKSHRSLNGQVEFVVERFIQDYETKNGEIPSNGNDISGMVIQNNHGGTNVLTAGNSNNYLVTG